MQKYVYYVHDLYSDQYIGFVSKSDLYWWKLSHCPDCEINVTGKDIYAIRRWHPEPEREEPEYYLRRWQFFDKDWRSIDVRDWSKQDFCQRDERRMPVGTSRQHQGQGKKARCNRRIHMPSGIHRSLIADAILSEIPEIAKHQNARYDYRCNKISCSWKDQTKAGKQWAKHKRRWSRMARECPPDPWSLYEEELHESA